MTDRFVYVGSKKLRCGITTGSCAAAAAKAAAMLLFENRRQPEIDIETPGGSTINIVVGHLKLENNQAMCVVIKDAGDDPDITDGIKIYAKAIKKTKPGIEIKAGEGIGIVTKNGLAVKPGKPAINPVPMRMIVSEVRKVIPENAGVVIEISAPEGIEIAKRTFNPKLGIMGGISILGTTGIVEPMSEDSFKESLELKLSVLKEEGVSSCVMTPGNIGERFLSDEFKINESRIVITSNFIGFMLDKAVCYGIKNIVLCGHIGKLVKIAGGIFNTHSKTADARNEIFASHYAYFSGDHDGFRHIMESNTTEEAVEYVKDMNFFIYLAKKIKSRCEEYVFGELNFETILLSQTKGILAMTEKAKEIISSMKENK